MKWLIGLFLLSVVVSASQPPTPGASVAGEQQQQQRTQETSGANNQSASGNASVLVATQRQPDRNTPQNKSGGENPNSPWEWGTIADWAIVAFTAVLTVFTAVQIHQNKRNRMLAEALERARFSIENRRFEQAANGEVAITYEIANRGRSVAKVRRSATTTMFLATVPQPVMELRWKDAPEVVQAGDALVRETRVLRVDVAVSHRLAIRETFITVIGGVEYDDIFGKTHIRRYAFMYEWGGSFVPPKGDAADYNDET